LTTGLLNVKVFNQTIQTTTILKCKNDHLPTPADRSVFSITVQQTY